MNFTKGQEDALLIMESGSNVFITGEAGTGKSFVVNEFIRRSRDSGKEVMVTAPTGTAADNIGGMTIHRAFGAPVGVIPDKKVTSRDEVLQCVDIIIIDEISMCRFDLFDYIGRLVEYENNQRQSDRMIAQMEGGVIKEDIQLIVMGDFYQLPPVMTNDDKDILTKMYPTMDFVKGYAFKSKYWKSFCFDFVMLTENIRQEDTAFKNVLTMIRTNKNKKACAEWLNSKASDFPFDDDESIYLSATNKHVNQINAKRLEKIDSEEYIFHAKIVGDVKQSEKFAEDEIHLKVGCKVMLTVNDSDGDYVNGTIGIVDDIDKYNGRIWVHIPSKDKEVCIERYQKEVTRPVVNEKEKTVTEIDENGEPVKVTRVVSSLSDEVVGSFTQFPVRLAYAITIHKSQGKTFEHMNMNPYCWDEGQFYTGVSRCKKIENICFMQPVKTKYIVSSDEVIKEFAR